MVLRYAGRFHPGKIRVSLSGCPLCGFPLLVRISEWEHHVRCPRCRAGVAHLAMASVLAAEVRNLRGASAYEMSSRGALVRFLRGSVGSLTLSELFPDVPVGQTRDGIRCEDVQALTFADASFDLCTSTDVFEHVADDAAGFSEVLRVLRAGGKLIFTVPLSDEPATVERARLRNGELQHLLPPEYHDDRLRGEGRVLAFRNYGRDIVERLQAAGFARAEICDRYRQAWFCCGREVVVAEKAQG